MVLDICPPPPAAKETHSCARQPTLSCWVSRLTPRKIKKFEIHPGWDYRRSGTFMQTGLIRTSDTNAIILVGTDASDFSFEKLHFSANRTNPDFADKSYHIGWHGCIRIFFQSPLRSPWGPPRSCPQSKKTAQSAQRADNGTLNSGIASAIGSARNCCKQGLHRSA